MYLITQNRYHLYPLNPKEDRFDIRKARYDDDSFSYIIDLNELFRVGCYETEEEAMSALAKIALQLTTPDCVLVTVD